MRVILSAVALSVALSCSGVARADGGYYGVLYQMPFVFGTVQQLPVGQEVVIKDDEEAFAIKIGYRIQIRLNDKLVLS